MKRSNRAYKESGDRNGNHCSEKVVVIQRNIARLRRAGDYYGCVRFAQNNDGIVSLRMLFRVMSSDYHAHFGDDEELQQAIVVARTKMWDGCDCDGFHISLPGVFPKDYDLRNLYRDERFVIGVISVEEQTLDAIDWSRFSDSNATKKPKRYKWQFKEKAI